VRITLTVLIDAPPAAIWASVSDLASHAEWMQDVVAIRFATNARSGTGVVMDCDIKIGPVRLTDRLVVTEWHDGRAIEIRHEGPVAGTGRFVLALAGPDKTVFTWTEDLRLPWRLGGSVAAVAARPVLAWTWRRSLTALRSLIETRPPPTGTST